MDRLAAMTAFAEVVEYGSFTAAAERLRLPKSTVSKQVAALERHLGVRLLDRTTRRLALTEAGRTYLAWCARILADLGEAERAAVDLHAAPRGRLRINAPISFGVRHLAPLVPEFLAAYPEIAVDLDLVDRRVDPVQEGYDAVVRIGRLPDSSLVARRIGGFRRVVVGSPAYLDRHGRPATPNDLARHVCLVYDRSPAPSSWRFRIDGADTALRVNSRLTSNNGDVLRSAALAGAGLFQAPMFFFGEDIAAGRLETVLTEHEPSPTDLQVLYPPGLPVSAKLRAFVDFLIARLPARLGGG